MRIVFFEQFMKPANSFKIPGDDYPGLLKAIYDGEIKGDFSPLNPVVRFKNISAESMPTATYCYIASFRRYYFMSWAFVSGFWEASLTCDVLGSFRAEVLATTQYVKRSASNKNLAVSDAANYPSITTHGGSISYVQQADLWGVNFYTGTVVISVVNSTLYNIGANTYYAMSYTSFRALMYALLNSPNWMQIDTSEISAELQKALINPAQYITSAVWLPINSTSFVDGGPAADISTTIRFGWWSFDLQSNVRILHAPFGQTDSWSRTVIFNLANHPQYDRGHYLNLAPYTKRTLEFQPFGCIDLDTTDLVLNDKLTCRVFIQSYTGDAIMYVYSGDYTQTPEDARLIASLEGCVGIPLPVGQIRVDASKFKSAVIGGAAVGIADYLGGAE